MSQQVIGIGTTPNDKTGDPARTAFQKTNANFTELYSAYTKTVFAGSSAFVGTVAQRISGAIASATALGFRLVLIPASFLPYDVSLVTGLTAFHAAGGRLICEGGSVLHYDTQAYGADPAGVLDATLGTNTALAGAITNGARCICRAGVYSLATFVAAGDGSISRALVITGSVEFVGEGTVFFKNTGATVGAMLRVNDNPQTAPVVNVLVEGIGFDGNGMQQGVGVQVFNCQDVIVRRNHFKNFSNLSGTQFSYGIRVEGYGVPANPFVWTAALPAGFSQRVRVQYNTFDAFSAGGAGSPNCIFHYQTDGCITEGNSGKGCGILSMTFGPNRRHSVVHNELSDGNDNGIRFEQDVQGDLQRNQGHTVVGNIIRNMFVDGIRLNCSRTTVKGNVSHYNGNCGIKADNSEHLVIEGNDCSFNGNRGIFLTLATIVGQVSHTHCTIANNDCVSNAGDGIGVIGGGASNVIPAAAILILGNRCRFNGFQGILLVDGDARCQISHNICEQNGNGGAGFASGIQVQASQISWGGCTISFNRCFDTNASPNAKQPIGIWLRPTAGGVTLQRCYCYMNDCSDVQNSATWFGAAIATNYGVTGTQSGHFLVGTLYRNATRGVTIAQVGQNLTANDILVQLDEGGFFGITQKGLSGISADRGDASVSVQAGVDNEIQFFNTPLTANRTVTLSATGAYNGARFRVVRSAAATGASALTVQTLLGGNKALAVGQEVEAHWNGAAWVETMGSAIL